MGDTVIVASNPPLATHAAVFQSYTCMQIIFRGRSQSLTMEDWICVVFRNTTSPLHEQISISLEQRRLLHDVFTTPQSNRYSSGFLLAG